MKIKNVIVLLVLLAGVALAPAAALAGSSYGAGLVPNVAGANPGFSGSGSGIKLNELKLRGKVKKVVDALGDKVTTDPDDPTDDYTVEIDLEVPATAAVGTVVVPFDVKKGNGKFKADLSSDPLLAGAVSGDAVLVKGVAVKDDLGAVLGGAGVAVK